MGKLADAIVRIFHGMLAYIAAKRGAELSARRAADKREDRADEARKRVRNMHGDDLNRMRDKWTR